MRTSDAVKVDHEYRHWRKATSLRASIDARHSWYRKHHPDRLSPLHENRITEISAVLDRELAAEKLVWEINTYLSRQPVLKLPTAQIMDYIFYNLPPPRKAQLTDLEHHMATLMTKRYHQAMAKQHYFNLMCEIAYRAKQNWYFIFNTLTVAPEVYNYAFSKEAPYFTNYIRKIDRLAAKSTYGSVRAAANECYHTYLACTEQGAQNGRLHLHILHCFRNLPDGCTDPNYGRAQPTERNPVRCIC